MDLADFDFDPERALWRPSRRAFLFLGGSAALGVFVGQGGFPPASLALPLAPPSPPDGSLVEVLAVVGAGGTLDVPHYAVLMPSTNVKAHGLVASSVHPSIWRLSVDAQILWRPAPAQSWPPHAPEQPKYFSDPGALALGLVPRLRLSVQNECA